MSITRPFAIESANAPTTGASSTYDTTKLCLSAGVIHAGSCSSRSSAIAAISSALSASARRVRAYAPGAEVLAVVKANAYGHGLDRVMPALAGADGLALIELDAAVRLRERGYRRPILLLQGFFDAPELDVIAAHE